MKSLKNTLAQFPTLGILFGSGDNFVIGGSHALKLHGLELGREPNDVDIIIYQPTECQQVVLKMMEEREEKKTFSTKLLDKLLGIKVEREGSPGRVTKLKSTCMSKEYSVDIIVSDLPTPKGLLKANIFSYQVMVQSIANIVDAKASYVRQVDNRGSKLYLSEKDCSDLMELKNLNFNI